MLLLYEFDTYALFQNMSASYAFHTIKITSIVLRWFSDVLLDLYPLTLIDMSVSYK